MGVPLVGNIKVDFPTTSSSPTPTPSGHNQALEKLVSAYKQSENARIVAGAGAAYPTFTETWHNDNHVTVEAFFPGNYSFTDNSTWVAFSTTQDATNYLNGLNKSNYRVLWTDPKDDAYAEHWYNATGHYAQTYHSWGSLGALQPPLSGHAIITQWDNILKFDTMRFPVLRNSTATSSA